MRRRMTTLWIAAFLLATVAAVSPAGAQVSGPAAELEDGRWLPYLGCWVDVDEPVGPLTCVVPDGSGVEVLTVVDGEVVDRRALHAGSGDRPVEDAGCSGSAGVSFSSDGDRAFTRTDLTCAGVERSTRGLIAMVEADRWIEVQALGGNTNGAAWVKRYRPAPVTRIENVDGLAEQVAAGSTPAVAAARAAASASVSVDDLIEAHASTHPEAVRAWLVEDGERLQIDSDALIRLADAGVDPAVIDVAVAVSFPDRFDFERGGQADRDSRALGSRGYLDGYGYDRFGAWGGWSMFGPYYYDPFYARYDRFYRRGYWHSGGSYRPTRIVVVPTAPASPGGRAVNGRGYTRGGGGSDSAAKPRGASGSQSAVSSKGQRATSSVSKKAKAKAKEGGGG